MDFSMKDFFSKCDQFLAADLVTITKEILNGKSHFFQWVKQALIALLVAKVKKILRENCHGQTRWLKSIKSVTPPV